MRTTFRSLVLIAVIQVFVAVIQVASLGAATAAQIRDAALSGYEPGTIVVKTSERRLYYVLENGQTISYPIAVGKAGKTWAGGPHNDGKFLNPPWRPPGEIPPQKPNPAYCLPGRPA